jgi:Golgi phosphoprotein 3 GPP34
MHERPAPGSAGRRHRPARGLSGTGLVGDDLYLLGHDYRSGRPLLQPRVLGTGLAGALLAELMLAGWIGLRRDSAVVIAADAHRGAVQQHALLRQIASEPGPQPARQWLRFLAHNSVPDVALRLGEAGYLEYAASRIPWRRGRWIPVDPDWAFSPMLRVRSALDRAQPVTPYAAVLTGLAVASGLGFRLDQYQTRAGRGIEQAVGVLGPGLQELIAQTQTAVDSAVLSHRT